MDDVEMEMERARRWAERNREGRRASQEATEKHFREQHLASFTPDEPLDTPPETAAPATFPPRATAAPVRDGVGGGGVEADGGRREPIRTLETADIERCRPPCRCTNSQD